MPTPVTLQFGPFDKGYNDSNDSALLGPGQAQDALGVDLSSGTLAGFWGPGTALAATVPVSSVSLAYAGRNAWIGNAYPQWSCDDAPTAAGLGVTYLTANTAGVAIAPITRVGATSYPIGIAVPAAPALSNGGIGSSANETRSFAITAVTADGFESNPSPSSSWTYTTSGNYALVTAPSSYSDARVTSFNLYVTDPEAGLASFFYRANLLLGGTVVVFNGFDTNPSKPLNWAPGGNPGIQASTADHSVAPNLTVLSNAIHSISSGAGTPGSGILFGAVGSVVWWSMLGYAQYWPTSNNFPLPETIEAITTGTAQTLIFTKSGIWMASGSSDFDLTLSRSHSEVGCIAGAGKTVRQSPYGVLFLCREGVGLFNGSTTTIITQGIINPTTLAGGGYTHAQYYDGCYFLFGTNDTFIFDFRQFIAYYASQPANSGLRVTRNALLASASHVTTSTPTGGAAGLYIATAAGVIQPWRPTDVGLVAGSARTAWTWKTANFTSGAQNSPKRYTRMFYRGAKGTGATFSFYLDGSTTALFSKTVADMGAHPGNFWLPGSAQGREITVKIVSTDGTSILYDARLESEVQDGA